MVKKNSEIKSSKKSVIDFGIKENRGETIIASYQHAKSAEETSLQAAQSDHFDVSGATIHLVSALIQGQGSEILKENKLFEILKITHSQVNNYKTFIKAKKPAVPIEASVHTDYLLSLFDGKRYTVLSKHARKYGMTAEEYKATWGLPDSYPTVAEAYSNARRMLAKKTGLGTKRGKQSI